MEGSWTYKYFFGEEDGESEIDEMDPDRATEASPAKFRTPQEARSREKSKRIIDDDDVSGTAARLRATPKK